MMEDNSYVWFFVGLLSAAALKVVVENLARLAADRRLIRAFPATILWNLFLVLLVVEMWIASPLLSDSSTSISTHTFLIFIIFPISATVMAYMIQPDFDELASGSNTSQNKTLQGQFNYNRMSFFAILLFLPCVSIASEFFQSQSDILNADFAFRVLIAICAIFGFFIRKPRTDAMLAVLMIVLIVVYTLTVFPSLNA